MSVCNTCARGFGFFSKEMGCPRCKRIFCKNCLNHKIPESPENLKKLINVCLRCSKIPLNDVSPNKAKKQEQIEELLKLSPKEEAFAPVLEPVSVTSCTDDIRSRLDALKQTDLPDISQNDDESIKRRLAELKGVEFKADSNAKIHFTPDTRSEQEKIDDLLKQFVEETAIDYQSKPESAQTGTVEDIEKRLAALRGQDIEKTKQQIEQTEETEEEETARTMKQYLEEAKLEDLVLDPDEEELIATIPPAPGQKKDFEELPFCEICNEDASLRCLECEDLFCANCFREFHEEEDYKTHKTKPYQAPKTNEV